jgi:hypothetical protein
MDTANPSQPGLTLRQLDLLLLASLIIWFLRGLPSRLFPDAPLLLSLAHGLNFLVALLVAVGLFFALQHWYFHPVQQTKALIRLAGFFVIAFIAISLGFIVYVSSITLPLMAKASAERTVPIFEKTLTTEENLDERVKTARALYLFTGSAYSYPGPNGQIVTYQPSDSDQATWHLLQEETKPSADGAPSRLETSGRYGITAALAYIAAVIAGVACGCIAIVKQKRQTPA